ncbi:MAG: hypothetical protein NVSMB57_17380 [Actinomycetota bacterium]
MKRLIAIFFALATMLTATSSASAAKGCPAATSCGLYQLSSARWPTTHGVLTIHYQLSTVTPSLTPDLVVLAVQAATRTWEEANPNVHFVLDRATSDMPQLGDGVNQIAFVPTLEPGVLAVTNQRMKGSRIVESDLLLNISKPWGWFQCGSNAIRCTDDTSLGAHFMDLQAVVTQQLGHWLSLESLTTPQADELTMYDGIGYGQRHQDTLGLGDVLGVRAAYPCGRCRMPRIVTP